MASALVKRGTLVGGGRDLTMRMTVVTCLCSGCIGYN